MEDDEDNGIRPGLKFEESVVWNKLYDFQKDAVVGAIRKLEKYKGCIIADSVGLGKTYEALAVMKYYQERNDRILVLCPKRLRDNWTLWTQDNDDRNPLADDRFSYTVLNHTDLSRYHGMSGEVDLEHLRWGHFDLLVIDESHNFRNKSTDADKTDRYTRLIEDVTLHYPKIVRSPPRFFYFPLFPCSLPLPKFAFLLPLNLPYYIPLLPSITSDCCRLDDYVSLHYLLKHMAHLVQAAVWTAGLDDRLTDSGLISFQLCKAYAPPVGVKGQISTVCLYTAGGNLASKDNFILFYLGRFDGGTVFRCIMISPGKIFPGRIEGEGEIRFQQLRP